MTEHAVLHLAIAYLGVQTFRMKDVVEFVKDSDVKITRPEILMAMKEMGCYKITQCSNQNKWRCPGIPSISVVTGHTSNLTGQRFGRWTVIKLAGRNPKSGEPMWLCKCDCGTEKVVRSSSLKSGASRSCGCLSREVASERAKKGIRKKFRNI